MPTNSTNSKGQSKTIRSYSNKQLAWPSTGEGPLLGIPSSWDQCGLDFWGSYLPCWLFETEPHLQTQMHPTVLRDPCRYYQVQKEKGQSIEPVISLVQVWLSLLQSETKEVLARWWHSSDFTLTHPQRNEGAVLGGIPMPSLDSHTQEPRGNKSGPSLPSWKSVAMSGCQLPQRAVPSEQQGLITFLVP